MSVLISDPSLSLPSHRVKRLSPWVAERIAAGEVIERPGSVVKELLENSLDAGATEIAVRLEDGGKSLIEVIDNGYGMHPDDLELAIERHATSKLENLEDLEKIRTLGFRGEALPSVAAVSELTLLSRSKNETQAYELRASRFVADEQLTLSERRETPGPKAVTYGHFLGTPHGTLIRAQGLFAQVPARLKFLKSQASEVSFVREWMERLALTHPHVGFKLFSDTRTVLNLRPVSEVERVRQILCDGEDYPIVSAESDPTFMDSNSTAGIRVRVHWVQGLSTPQTRKLVQVVNKRALRDRVLQQAMLNPLRQLFLPGQFPAIALFVDVHPSEIDVNVHPTKTEVRFLESRKLFSEIGRVVQKLVNKNGAPMFVAGTPSESTGIPTDSQGIWAASQPDLEFRKSSFVVPSGHAGHSPHASNSGNSGIFSSAAPTYERTASSDVLHTSPDEQNPLTAHPFEHAHYIGALFETYLLFQQGDDLVLIDQHAAHERIQYEKLKKRALTLENPPIQELLLPEVVRFQTEYRTDLESRLPLLSLLGFETEIFGEDSLLFRSIPAEWGSQQLRTRLKSLVDRLLKTDCSTTLAWDESLFEKIASEACHSAIRAGDRLTAYEAKDLVDQLFQCEHAWNCPHGRPSVVKMPRARFEEWFLRRV